MFLDPSAQKACLLTSRKLDYITVLLLKPKVEFIGKYLASHWQILWQLDWIRILATFLRDMRGLTMH
ncbi:hypothetical protein AgCh_009493 [Apium graveolens]